LYQTAKKFKLNMKTSLRWATSEKIISKSTKGSKHRRPDHPRVEAALLEEFKELRKKEVKVKGYWFKLTARQLPAEIEQNRPSLGNQHGPRNLRLTSFLWSESSTNQSDGWQNLKKAQHHSMSGESSSIK
jgi:hypothetical protein